jgi:CHAD domain-containing protein
MERELGAARDFDVFFAAVVDRPHEQYRNASVRAMRHALSDRRDAVYARLGQSLQARRCRNLELAVARWVEVGPWITSGNSAAVLRRDRPVSYLAADVLANCRKKVKRRGEHLGRLNPADRHKLRIRVKTLRYAVEFFSEVFPGEKRAKRCREALAALVDLQDSLGALNDLVKRESLSSPQNRVPSSDAATAFELAPRLLAKGGQKTRLLRRAKHAFKSFCAVKPFWK